MRTVVGFVCAGGVFIGLLALSEAVTRRWLLRAESGRKIAHITSGIFAAILPAFLSFPAIAALAAAFIPFLVVSRRIKLFPVIHQAERSTLGEIYFPVGIFLIAALEPHVAEYVFGVLAMGLGDAFANLVGERFGRRTYHITAKKTFEGTATMFVTTWLVGIGALASISKLNGVSLAGIGAVSLLLAIEEGVCGAGLDNVLLPLSAAALFRLLI